MSMKQSKFVFDADIPKTVMPELREYLLPCEWLIPSWCQKVRVGWIAQEDEDDAALSIEVHYAYRWARINVFPCFHLQTDKREMVIHEILHAFASVLANYARDAIKLLVPEDEAPKFRQSLLDELTNRHEALVQDLTYCIVRKLDGNS